MPLAGLTTCSTLLAVFAPEDALMSLFGANLTEPLANVVVRSWGFLVFLMGALLIYGVFRPESRMLCIVTAGISKNFFAVHCVVGSGYADAMRLTEIFDAAVVAVLAVYVIASKDAAFEARKPALEKCWALRALCCSTLGKASRGAQRSIDKGINFSARRVWEAVAKSSMTVDEDSVLSIQNGSQRLSRV
jgi:hypothetical protein